MSELVVNGASVRYGEAVAVDEVSLTMAAGSITAVVGSNGAGKTSLLKCISGLVPAAAGQILLDGRNITAMPTYMRARAGLVHVPEGRGLIPELTVWETLVAASDFGEAKRRRTQQIDTVLGLFPRLAERRRQIAGTLSGGEQQMLAIGRGLMTLPRVLLLDEPSLGLAPKLAREMLASVREIQRASEIAVLLVEQNVKLALQVCDRGMVMESGALVLQGDPEDLLADPRVVSAYLGAHPSDGEQAAQSGTSDEKESRNG